MAKLLENIVTYVCENSAMDIYAKPTFFGAILKLVGNGAAHVGKYIPGGMNVHKDIDTYPGFYPTKAELVDRKALSLSQKRLLSNDPKFKRGLLCLVTGSMVNPDKENTLIERQSFMVAADLKKIGITELPKDRKPIGSGKTVIQGTKQITKGTTHQFWVDFRTAVQTFKLSKPKTHDIDMIRHVHKNHPERIDKYPIANFMANKLTP